MCAGFLRYYMICSICTCNSDDPVTSNALGVCFPNTSCYYISACTVHVCIFHQLSVTITFFMELWFTCITCTCTVRAKMKCVERTRLGPNQTEIKSVPLWRTSTGSCQDLDRTGVGFASTRHTVFDVHHRSQGLSSLSKFVVILWVCRNSRSPSSLLKSVVVLQVHCCYRSSSIALEVHNLMCCWSTKLLPKHWPWIG